MDEQKPQTVSDSEKTFSRRQALRIGLWGAASGAFGAGVVSSLADHFTDNVINVTADLLGFSTDRDLGEVFREFTLGVVPEISTGNFNIAANISGKGNRPSPYVLRAGVGITGAVCSAFPNYEPRSCKDFIPIPFSETKHAIYLGGPFANPDSSAYLGYDLSGRDRLNPDLPAPRARADFQLPFEFLNGETTRGEFDGIVETALRYDGGREVSRPVWRIRDRRNDQIIRCAKDGDWLAQEYLQVIRLIDSLGRVKIFAWGLHGHSLAGFFLSGKGIKTNLEELVERTRKTPQFHALIPVSLERAKAIDQRYMKATADWREVDKNRFIVDLKNVFGSIELPSRNRRK